MSFSELKAQDNSANLFKALSSVAYLAPVSADPVETLLDPVTKDIKALPASYKPIGMITEDGINMSGDSSEEEVRAHGYLQAVRTDITESTREVTLTALEVLKENLLEVAYGVDLTSVARDENGELKFDRPQLPENKHWRLIVIVKDVDKYQARFFPKAKIASVPEEVWSAADAQSFELTFRAEFDNELGTNERYFSVVKSA